MKYANHILIGVALLLFVSCGQQQQAKSLIKDFMAQQLADASELSYIDFSDIDSTRVVSDSALTVMRSNVSARYKSPQHYTERKSDKLILMRVHYLLGNDTCSTTFYMDAEMEGVVAFKENR